MGILGLLLVAATADPDDGLTKQMLPIYVKEAETYSLAVESAPNRALVLQKEPVFEWLNPARNTQQGAVFLWLRDGRPASHDPEQPVLDGAPAASGAETTERRFRRVGTDQVAS